MAVVRIYWQGEGHVLLEQAMRALGSERGTKAAARAVDHTGKKLYTQVARTLAKQVGLPLGKLKSLGNLKKRATFGTNPEFVIRSSGRPLSLHQFGARQTAKGVKAKPYGKSTLFKSAFLVPRWNNEVYWRVGSSRFPVQRVVGPHIPRELVRYQTQQLFQTFVSRELPKRLQHEIRVLTKGVVS